MTQIVSVSKLGNQLNIIRDGCLIDTNVLFAFYHSNDDFYGFAQKVYDCLSTNSISVYTNVNIKLEFIDLFRRSFIHRGICTHYNLEKSKLSTEEIGKLKTLAEKDRLYDQDVKSAYKFFDSKQKNGWKKFCSNYLSKALFEIWNETEKQWNMKLLSYKTDKALFIKEPEWKGMILFVERFGIGSSDAMILNFFLCSKIPLLLTADKHMLYTIKKSNLFKNKIVAVPDSFTQK